MTPEHTGRLTPPVGERDHVRGTAAATLTLVEFGDFESPACARAQLTVVAVRRIMGDRLRFVFRHFPLSQDHHHAERAAEAAEAAGSQGFFWPMHDALFAHQPALDDDDLLRYAAHVLDLDRFTRELAEHTWVPRIRADVLSGLRSGVTGTPTFFVNGLRHEGPVDQQSLITVLERAAGGW